MVGIKQRADHLEDKFLADIYSTTKSTFSGYNLITLALVSKSKYFACRFSIVIANEKVINLFRI